MLRRFQFIGLVAAVQVHAQFIGCLDCRVDQVSDDLVAVRCDADRFPQADKLADHPSTRVGLTGTGWALNR